MNELALFAGAGGGILGGKLLGWRTVCAVEYEPHAAAILAKRQNDRILEPFPIWDDVRTFDGKPWKGIVDVVSGGFPCQDISCAGRGKGISGERSGLWGEMARIIREVRPRYALVENSPMLTIRGLDVVLGDLATMGYDARWGVLGADIFGAPHKRERIWVVANSNKIRRKSRPNQIGRKLYRKQNHWDLVKNSRYWKHVPNIPRQALLDCVWEINASCGSRVFDDVANRVDRIEAIGNGQIPAVVRLAWEILGPGSNETESSKNT